jgi:hypothetical protein
MTVESFLTRVLDIRFIDARSIVSEARISLGIQGYPSKEQEQELTTQALKIFQDRPDDAKAAMQRLKANLDAVKMPSGSMSSRNHDMDSSEELTSSCDSFASSDEVSSGSGSKFFKTWLTSRQ